MLNDSQWRDRARFSLDFPLNRFPAENDTPKRLTMKKNSRPSLKAYANLLTRVKGKLARHGAECQKRKLAVSGLLSAVSQSLRFKIQNSGLDFES
jgi:hypothetical protein